MEIFVGIVGCLGFFMLGLLIVLPVVGLIDFLVKSCEAKKVQIELMQAQLAQINEGK